MVHNLPPVESYRLGGISFAELQTAACKRRPIPQRWVPWYQGVWLLWTSEKVLNTTEIFQFYSLVVCLDREQLWCDQWWVSYHYSYKSYKYYFRRSPKNEMWRRNQIGSPNFRNEIQLVRFQEEFHFRWSKILNYRDEDDHRIHMAIVRC